MVAFETGVIGFVAGLSLGLGMVIGLVSIAYVKKYRRLIDTMESLNDTDSVEIIVRKRVE